MRTGDILTLLPLVVMIAAPIVVMLATAWFHSHLLALVLTVASMVVTLATLAVPAGRADRAVGRMVVMDGYSLFFIGLIAIITIVVAFFSYSYMKRGEEHPIDYYSVLLITALGGAALAAATHFASFFIALEILSVGLYVLIAYPRVRTVSVEAAIKYLILAGATSAALLFGMALVYAQTGRMDVAGLTAARVHGVGAEYFFIAGAVLILVGVGFKLALVPFHMWTPDVYQGAPAPVTALIATLSKAAVIAVVLRFVRGAGLPLGTPLDVVLTVVAMASMIFGNLLALLQDNVKRILAYSSIAQLGYLLVPIIAGGTAGTTAVLFFTVAYVLTSLAAFGVVSALSSPLHEAEGIDEYTGLGQSRPWLAGAFTVALLSLAGIPLTAGFIGKFYLVTAGAGASRWALLVVLVLTSAVSVYYYTRIIVVMYVRARAAVERRRAPVASRLAAALVALVTLAVLFFGVYPRPLVSLSDRAAAAVEVSSVAGAGRIPASLRPSPAPSPASLSASPSPAASPSPSPSPSASGSRSPAAGSTAAATPSPSPSASGSAAAGGGNAGKGEALFASLGCKNCHSTTGQNGIGPTLKGVSGSTVKLTTGQSVTADDAYLLRSIEQPDAQIVQGYSKGVMSGVIKPGSVSQTDAQALVAYIKTL